MIDEIGAQETIDRPEVPLGEESIDEFSGNALVLLLSSVVVIGRVCDI